MGWNELMEEIRVNNRVLIHRQDNSLYIPIRDISSGKTLIQVRQPNCEHEFTTTEGDGRYEPFAAVTYCDTCGASGVSEPPDEDGEIFINWEHEK